MSSLTPSHKFLLDENVKAILAGRIVVLDTKGWKDYPLVKKLPISFN